MFNYATPFSVRDGLLRDRSTETVYLNATPYSLPETMAKLELDLGEFKRLDVNFIALRLDENELVNLDGTLKNNQALELFDLFIHKTWEMGFHLSLSMINSWRFGDALGDYFKRPITDYDPLRAELRRFEVYFTGVFTHRNTFGDKPLYAYRHLASLEPLSDISYLPAIAFHWFAFLISPFIDHCFGDQILKIYSGDAGQLTPETLEKLRNWKYELIQFTPDTEKLRFNAISPALREAVFEADIRQSGAVVWHKLATVATYSKTQEPYRNGGGEGFVTFDSTAPVDVAFRFPVPVKSAKFRPSLRNSIDARIDGNRVELTMPAPRYGALEINYDAPDAPAYTIYILNDHMEENPLASGEYNEEKIKFLAPGEHRLADVEAGTETLLYFQPGTHRIEGNKLPLASNRDVFLPRGAVLQAGIAGHEVENVRVFGHGIIDGTTNIREPGENWRSLGEEGCVFLLRGKDVTIDGPILYNPQFWATVIAGTENMTIRNYKVLAWVVNDDGLQPRSCNKFLAENCFLKCLDDCVAVKTRKAIGMESRDLVFRDIVAWQDAQHGMEIGHTSQADILENVRFENIEFIRGGSVALSMHIMDHETVRNVVYDHIYFEGKPFRRYVGFYVHGDPSPYRTDSECGRVLDVTVKNLYFESSPYQADLSGYDAEHQVENIRFENVYSRDEQGEYHLITDLDRLNIEQKFTCNVSLSSE